MAVSSALAGLTSLFGMGRGGPCRCNHPKVFKIKVESKKIKVESDFHFCLLPFAIYLAYDINMERKHNFCCYKNSLSRLESLRVISTAQL